MTFKLNRQAFRELRNSPEVKAELGRRAKRVEAAAGEGYESEVREGRNRARASVRTEPGNFRAMARERRDNRLLKALEAGRG